MDVEVIKLVAEICILPTIGLFTAVIASVIGSWVTHQFNKNFEKYKQTISSQSTSTTQAQSQQAQPQTEDDNFLDWIGKVFWRGSLTVVYFAVGVFLTGLAFVLIRPFSVTFIFNRINELQQVPNTRQIISEVSAFVSLQLLVDGYILGIATIIGFFAIVVLDFGRELVFWIFDVKL